jgi:predicted Rossmann fold nucleotide-binding protein DprA/Smf involved in DNA uptake
MTETAVEGRKGRPRPQETIDRDELVYGALAEPKTKPGLVEATQLTANQVYLSLYRLKRDGRVTRQSGEGLNGHIWAQVLTG